MTIIGDQLPLIVDEVLAGQFDAAERQELALVLATIAAELAPTMIIDARVT